MAKIKHHNTLAIPVMRAFAKLGRDLKSARQRRRIPMALMSERASISRITLGKIEKGDPSVSIASYATVLFVLGMIERLSDLADVRQDQLGLELAEENLPKRIRLPKKDRK
jgi:transcriptional regulator with XRE-family HTH domain